MIGFVSPRTGAPLLPDREGDALVSADGERVPIVNGIPRFVCSDDYAGAFDMVLCLGVLPHTPSPEQSLGALWRMLAPGGLLVVDHYTWTLSRVTKLAPLYRMFLKRLAPVRSRRITEALVDVFFPLHW